MVVALGVFTAFLMASFTAGKKHLIQDYGTAELGFVLKTYAMCLLLPAAVWQVRTVSLDVSGYAWTMGVVSGLFGFLGLMTALAALRVEDLSAFKPVSKVSPIIVAVGEVVFFDLTGQPLLFAAAICAVVGAYLTLLEDAGPTQPVRRLFRDRGPQLALLTSVFAAGSALTTRQAAIEIPSLVLAAMWSGVIIVLLGIFLAATRQLPPVKRFLDGWVVPIAVVGAVKEWLVVVLFGLAPAAVVVPLFQLSVPLAVLFGGQFFDEHHVGRRLIGAAFVVAGVILVSL